jgi:hypothetical protein
MGEQQKNEAREKPSVARKITTLPSASIPLLPSHAHERKCARAKHAHAHACMRMQDANHLQIVVEETDLVIMASDGLFDNVAEEEIVRIVNALEDEAHTSGAQTLARPEIIAQRLAQRAHDLSLDKTIDSPFAILAKVWSRKRECGGGGKGKPMVKKQKKKKAFIFSTHRLSF